MRKMKKVLIALVSASALGALDAATTSTQFNISGSLSNSCTAANGGAISLGDLSTTGNDTTTVTVTCRTGTPYSMTATSTNGWQLKSGSTIAVAYTLTLNGTPPSGVNSTWSGTAGSTTAVNVTTQNQTGSSTGTVYTLKATNPAAAMSVAAGTYTDQVTINISYS